MPEFREFLEAPKQFSDFDILSLYFRKIKISEIAHSTGKSIGEIYRVLKRHDVSPNRLKTNHHYVLNFNKAGLSVSQIAELTGYTPRNVQYILAKNINEG
jgi:hypothetical protein